MYGFGVIGGGLRLANTVGAPGFRSRDQLCFSRRFVCLFARSGLRVSNAARNDLVAVLDDFPIPVPFVVAGHNAEFNAVCHVALGWARLRRETILMRIK
jgi:hypothetical protein